MEPGALRSTALGGLLVALIGTSCPTPSSAAFLPPPQALMRGAPHAAGSGFPRSVAVRRADATARASAPAGSRSVPDGAGGLYIAVDDFRDGDADIYLYRVTNAGTPAPGWPADGVPVCTAPGYQYVFGLLPDGANGVIVGWYDHRDDWYRYDVYAQRVSPAGVPQWATNGIEVLTGAQADYASFAADGTGGAVFAWTQQGATDTDVFALRRDGSGAIPAGWSAGGTPVCTATGDQSNVSIAATGAGGAIVTWEDPRGTTPQVFAQKLDGAGAVQWNANGNPVDDGTGYPSDPAVASDGAGGAFVFWSDPPGVKGQHVNVAGSGDWISSGVSLIGTTAYASEMAALGDGLGGAIVYFQNYFGVDEVRAQRVNAAGALQWGANGAQAFSPGSFTLDVVPDGAGGVMFAWERYTATGTETDVYAQRVGPTGTLQWTAGGVPVCVAAGSQYGLSAAPDGANGLLVAWSDARTLGNDLYCQRLNSAGVPQLAANGVAVRTDPGQQIGSLTVPDGAGGAFIAWNELRSGSFDIRARHYDAAGAPSGSGIGVTVAAGTQMLEAAVPDGAGGMVVAWIDDPDGQPRIVAQRFNASLAAQWTPGGVSVCSAAGTRSGVGLVSDGAGGAILAWMDRRASSDDIFAQRLDATGAPQWAADGIALCNDPAEQSSPALVADGAGGAIAAWSDARGGGTVYGQRVDASGIAQWSANGNLLASLTDGYARVDAVSDGAGGAVVSATSSRIDLLTFRMAGERLVVQRTNAAGAPQWGDSGTVVCDLVKPVQFPVLAPASGGGAIVAWSDGRSGPFDIRAQRLDGAGVAQWAAGGAVVCGAPGWQMMSGMVADGSGGAVLTWTDARGGVADVYAQRLGSTGAAQWTANGVAVCAAAEGQFAPAPAIDGSGNTILSWTDDRATPVRVIYAQRLAANGSATWTPDGVVPVQLSLASASADADGVHLRWWGPDRVTATVYRRSGDEPWTPLGTTASDASGVIAWHDRDALAGARYGYRLGVARAGGETAMGEVWVDVPVTLSLSIEGTRPNPIHGEFAVAFALPASTPATLEVFDPAGRLVRRIPLAGLSPGRHVQRLGALPRPGLFFLRLTQAGRSVTARAVVAP